MREDIERVLITEEELRENIRSLNKRLGPKGIRVIPLRFRNGRALIYLFRSGRLKADLCGRKLAIFGSYDWGDGDWMKDWEEDAKGTGALLVADGLICNLTPDAEGEEACRKLGALLV